MNKSKIFNVKLSKTFLFCNWTIQVVFWRLWCCWCQCRSVICLLFHYGSKWFVFISDCHFILFSLVLSHHRLTILFLSHCDALWCWRRRRTKWLAFSILFVTVQFELLSFLSLAPLIHTQAPQCIYVLLSFTMLISKNFVMAFFSCYLHKFYVYGSTCNKKCWS